MTISLILFGVLLIAWIAGLGSLGLHYHRRIIVSKTQGFFDNGLGIQISRAERPAFFKAVLCMYWLGVAGAAVMIVGGLVVGLVAVTGR